MTVELLPLTAPDLLLTDHPHLLTIQLPQMVLLHLLKLLDHLPKVQIPPLNRTIHLLKPRIPLLKAQHPLLMLQHRLLKILPHLSRILLRLLKSQLRRDLNMIQLHRLTHHKIVRDHTARKVRILDHHQTAPMIQIVVQILPSLTTMPKTLLLCK